ncbi:LPXTG cell wall anchor domain-containing protein [Vagococcus silagei]|nr:LPXTG cell wall anchor domain-containing protein [Vagococcus silagei]
MKKRVILLLSLIMLTRIGTIQAFAEDTNNATIKDNAETTQTITDETQSTDTAKTPVTQELLNMRLRVLNILIHNKKISQGEYDQTVAKVKAAKTNEELEGYMNEITKNNQEAGNYWWSFSEAYLNIGGNIDTLLKQGKIDSNYAKELKTRLDSAMSREDLYAVRDELDATIKDPDIGIDPPKTTDQTNFTTTTNSTTKPTTKPTTSTGKLPQTGEQKSKWMMIVGGIVIIAVVIVIVMKNKAKTKEVEDKTEDE